MRWLAWNLLTSIQFRSRTDSLGQKNWDIKLRHVLFTQFAKTRRARPAMSRPSPADVTGSMADQCYAY